VTIQTSGQGAPKQATTSKPYSDGEDVREDDPWVSLRTELRPDKALVRTMATARAVVSSVSLVAVALTVLGLVGSAELKQQPVLSFLAAGAGLLALAAALLALWYGARRPERINVENNVDVRAWVDRQVRRVWMVTAASRVLILALVIAAVVVLATIFLRAPASPLVTLSEQGTGVERTVAVQVRVVGQEPAAPIDVELTTVTGVLFRAQGVTDSSGNASISGTVENVPPATSYRLEVAVAGHTTVVTLP